VEDAVRHILLVDDSVFFRGMLAPVLEAAGYQVTCAASAKAALSALQTGCRFDAIITDLEMPEMDGFALTPDWHRYRQGFIGCRTNFCSCLISIVCSTLRQPRERHDAVGKIPLSLMVRCDEDLLGS
jgi:CheY-like chemotaxis protein